MPLKSHELFRTAPDMDQDSFMRQSTLKSILISSAPNAQAPMLSNSGILGSPPVATSLFSWTEAALRVVHEAISATREKGIHENPGEWEERNNATLNDTFY